MEQTQNNAQMEQTQNSRRTLTLYRGGNMQHITSECTPELIYKLLLHG
jgi:hypothetical protein